MNKIITFLLASTCSLTFFNTFSMLSKHILYTTKYIRTVQTQEHNRSERIKKLLYRDQFRALEGEEAYRYEEDDLLKNLYFRNSTVIELLKEDIDDIKKKIKILKEQQDRAISSLGIFDTDVVEKLEKQLHKSFNIDKETE